MTKPIVVLTLGCLPLAVLTAFSFAGIADLDLRLPSIAEGDLMPAGASVSIPSAQDLADDETLRAALAEREFLAGEPLADRALETDPLYWETLVADWEHWSDATALVREILALEEDLIGAKVPQLESAVKQIETIQDDCRIRDPAGSARLVRVLNRRRQELLDQIANQRRYEKAMNLIVQAQREYEAGEFSKSFEKYDEVWLHYRDVLAPETIAAPRRLAAFWRDEALLRLTSPVTVEPSKQRESLVGFLSSYKGLEGEEGERIELVSNRLNQVNAELRRLEMNQQALQPLSTLDRYDDRPFDEGLAIAARIAETYPTNWVRSQLQERVNLWLAQALPSKQFNEPSEIQEVEDISGNVLRGFFEPVADASGGVIAYKSHPTAEERRNPTRNVGRYPAANLRGVPTVSVPRQCVDAYESARSRLLADPRNRDCWTALARMCDSAETTLIDYRRKPGSSREALSFNREGQFAKAVLVPSVWSQMEAIWGK